MRDFGAFLSIARGIEGLLPAGECGLRPGEPITAALRPGETVSARVLELDAPRERIAFSLCHSSGARIERAEAANRALWLENSKGAPSQLAESLKDKLAAALRRSG